MGVRTTDALVDPTEKSAQVLRVSWWFNVPWSAEHVQQPLYQIIANSSRPNKNFFCAKEICYKLANRSSVAQEFC